MRLSFGSPRKSALQIIRTKTKGIGERCSCRRFAGVKRDPYLRCGCVCAFAIRPCAKTRRECLIFVTGINTPALEEDAFIFMNLGFYSTEVGAWRSCSPLPEIVRCRKTCKRKIVPFTSASARWGGIFLFRLCGAKTRIGRKI